MAVTEEHVRAALEQVIDPELFVNIVDLGLIYKVDIVEGPPGEAATTPASAALAAPAAEAPTATLGESPAPATDSPSAASAEAPGGAAATGCDVLIEMTMTSPACPAGPELLGRSKSVVGALEGVRSVNVKLVMTPPWSPDRMTEAARDQLGIF